jgi:Cd2+/Zn2+-exporting ATPase
MQNRGMMTESTLQLEIPVLLPGVADERDRCVQRLNEQLAAQKGIQQAHVERTNGQALVCLHYDPNLVTLEGVQRLAERAGAKITDRFHHVHLPIEGMDCSDCVTVLEHAVSRLDGVLAVSVNYAAQTMRVEFDSQKINQATIERRVRSLGYTIPAAGLRSWFQENRELLFSLAAGLLVLVGWAGGRFLGLPQPVSLALYIGAYILGGWDVSRHAFHTLRERHFDTDLLMVIAALGAAVLGAFAEGALLLFLFSLGHALEERALERARNAIKALADLAPRTALVRRNDAEVETPVEQLQFDDVVIVKPGARLPADGVVAVGRSAVNQAPVTGESLPVDKAPGDPVFAGTINGEGALEVRVTRLAKDSTLARVMQMVEEAQTQKSPTQQTVERFERIFVPAVLIGALLVIFVPPIFGVPIRESFLRAMTLLVAASPCALALGTPAAILAGVAQAARNGVLVKGGAHLENLGRLKAIAFDKTGTVTYGRPELTDIVALANAGRDAAALLALAAALESRSGHPLAQAVTRAAQAQGLALPEVADVAAITGRGLQGMLDGQAALLGNAALLTDAGVPLSGELGAQADAWQGEGKTVMFAALDSQVVGALAVADTLRPGVREVMTQLAQTGISQTIMLTGDNARAAAAIARQAGLQDVRADLMPEDKLAALKGLLQQYGLVGMVGDGVNDAPALAHATVGIAMGGAGTDVALETADVALMADDLSKLPFAVGLGRATRAIIIQNLAIALGVIGLLIITSLTGIVSIGIAIIFHEGSTLVVVANALRLLGYQGRKQ